MDSVAVLVRRHEEGLLRRTIATLKRSEMVKALAVAAPPDTPEAEETVLRVDRFWSGKAVGDCLNWFHGTGAGHLLLVDSGAPLLHPGGLRRMVSCLCDSRSSIVYGDYYDAGADGGLRLHPLIDYQPGSIRDTFDFGPVMLTNGLILGIIRKSFDRDAEGMTFGGMYDLRLRLCESAPALRLPEPLYRCQAASGSAGGHFAYVDPRNREYQLEMERIATAHLRRTGAFITPPEFRPLPEEGDFPVTATVVIPVKNRRRTIADAVRSALSQKSSFPYNVIVIDNHSTDGTTGILADIAGKDSRLVHRIPERTDLLIGGCWNEAVYSSMCGRYAVQLDSDDLYRDSGVLERIIAEFRNKPYALVIGSYTTVNFTLEPLSPGLVDHREWTDSNGCNNALRIAGLGAPRAYHVPTLRRFGFPDVSYGEDYAAVLRLCRSYPVGRIYESLYWCRRWEENSDSALPLETANRYDFYKDRLRTIEIEARIKEKV